MIILDSLPFTRVLGRSGKLSTDDESSSSCSSGHRISFRNISINKVAASLVLLGGLERVELKQYLYQYFILYIIHIYESKMLYFFFLIANFNTCFNIPDYIFTLTIQFHIIY